MEGIIFDFNGTMFFDGKLQEKAWRQYLENLTGRYVTDDEFQHRIHGVNAEDTFAYFLNRKLDRQEVIKLEEEKETIYRKLCLESPDFKLSPGLTDFLDKLKEKNIPITIATASNYQNVKFFFENLSLDKWFDLEKVVFNDGTLSGKPNPDIFLRAANKININIEDSVIFEDSPSGIKAGKNAKAKKVIGLSSMIDEDSLRDNGADEVITDFREIEKLLKV